MTPHDKTARRMRHPIRATGTLAILALLLTVGLFTAFVFEMVRAPSLPLLAGLGTATVASFLFWVRESHIASTAANAPARPRHEVKASWLIPLQAGLVMAYVAALLASIHYVPDLNGFPKGMLQGLPIGLATGWVVLWIYIILESDEMIRRLMITATAISAGAVLCLATFWGLIAIHDGLPEFGSIFLFPAFATIYGIAAMLLTRRYA